VRLLATVFVLASIVTLDAQVQTFSKVRMVFNQQEKIKREAARLMLRDDLILVVSRENGVELKRMKKADVVSLEISHGTMPRYSPEGAPPFFLTSSPLFFDFGPKDWVVIRTGNDAFALELDESISQAARSALVRFTGQRLIER